MLPTRFSFAFCHALCYNTKNISEGRGVDVKQILKENGFRFNKQFGQNFLTDGNVLSSIADDAEITGKDVVLEIGAGAGTLTRTIADRAERVVAMEIDRNLEKILALTLADKPNVKVVMGDVMRYPMEQIESMCGGEYKVVANIPYYITTPLIMNFVEQGKNVQSLTLTIQKEVAERLAASPATKQYGAITVGVNAVADVTLCRILPRNLFYPEPNVDSAVVRLDINRNKFDIADHAFFRKTVRIAFAMRRKTLVNNLTVGFKIDRTIAESILIKAGLSATCRGEELSVEQFVQLSQLLRASGIN